MKGEQKLLRYAVAKTGLIFLIAAVLLPAGGLFGEDFDCAVDDHTDTRVWLVHADSRFAYNPGNEIVLLDHNLSLYGFLNWDAGPTATWINWGPNCEAFDRKGCRFLFYDVGSLNIYSVNAETADVEYLALEPPIEYLYYAEWQIHEDMSESPGIDCQYDPYCYGDEISLAYDWTRDALWIYRIAEESWFGTPGYFDTAVEKYTVDSDENHFSRQFTADIDGSGGLMEFWNLDYRGEPLPADNKDGSAIKVDYRTGDAWIYVKTDNSETCALICLDGETGSLKTAVAGFNRLLSWDIDYQERILWVAEVRPFGEDDGEIRLYRIDIADLEEGRIYAPDEAGSVINGSSLGMSDIRDLCVNLYDHGVWLWDDFHSERSDGTLFKMNHQGGLERRIDIGLAETHRCGDKEDYIEADNSDGSCIVSLYAFCERLDGQPPERMITFARFDVNGNLISGHHDANDNFIPGWVEPETPIALSKIYVAYCPEPIVERFSPDLMTYCPGEEVNLFIWLKVPCQTVERVTVDVNAPGFVPVTFEGNECAEELECGLGTFPSGDYEATLEVTSSSGRIVRSSTTFQVRDELNLPVTVTPTRDSYCPGDEVRFRSQASAVRPCVGIESITWTVTGPSLDQPSVSVWPFSPCLYTTFNGEVGFPGLPTGRYLCTMTVSGCTGATREASCRFEIHEPAPIPVNAFVEQARYCEGDTVEAAIATADPGPCQGLRAIHWELRSAGFLRQTGSIIPAYDCWPVTGEEDRIPFYNLSAGDYEFSAEVVPCTGETSRAGCRFEVVPPGPIAVEIMTVDAEGNEESRYCPGEEVILHLNADPGPCHEIGAIGWRVTGMTAETEEVTDGEEPVGIARNLGALDPGIYYCLMVVVDTGGTVIGSGYRQFEVREWCPKLDLRLSPRLISYYVGQDIRFLLSADPGESGIGLLSWKWVNEETGVESPPQQAGAAPAVPYSEHLYCPGRGEAGTYHLEATLTTTDWERVTARSSSFPVVRPWYQNPLVSDETMGKASWRLGVSPSGPVFLEEGETGFTVYAWGYADGGIVDFRVECGAGAVVPPPVFTAGEKNARWDPGRWEIPADALTASGGGPPACELTVTMVYIDTADGREKTAVRRLAVISCPVEMLAGTKSAATEGIRKFRDGFMAKSKEGKELIEEYYRFEKELGLILLKDPKLAARTADFLKAIQKDLLALRKYGNPKLSPLDPANMKFVSSATVKEGLSLISYYRKYASPELQKKLVEFEKAASGNR